MSQEAAAATHWGVGEIVPKFCSWIAIGWCNRNISLMVSDVDCNDR